MEAMWFKVIKFFCIHQFYDYCLSTKWSFLIYSCLVLLIFSWLVSAGVLLWAFNFGYFIYRNVGILETQVPLSEALETFRHLESPVTLKVLTSKPSPLQKWHVQRGVWQGVASCRNVSLTYHAKVKICNFAQIKVFFICQNFANTDLTIKATLLSIKNSLCGTKITASTLPSTELTFWNEQLY